ncbi:MAG: hypothetical protein V3T01_00765 [Myxococcota bacterium]
MGRDDERAAEPETSAESPEEGQRCDFCGAMVPAVRRIALDGDYERLQTRHRVRYACPRCSEKKERARSGL